LWRSAAAGASEKLAAKSSPDSSSLAEDASRLACPDGGAYNRAGRGVTLGKASRARRPVEDTPVNEFVEPLGMRVLIRKDESRHTTRGGIVLPDQAEIPTITGRVVEVSLQVERDADFPIEKYDKVLFHPKNLIPVDFEQNNLLYVVPIEDVVAVFRRHDEAKPQRRGKTDQDEDRPADDAQE
jgi:chaperonin GroES